MRIYAKWRGQEVIYLTHLYIIHTKSKVLLAAKEDAAPLQETETKAKDKSWEKKLNLHYSTLCWWKPRNSGFWGGSVTVFVWQWSKFPLCTQRSSVKSNWACPKFLFVYTFVCWETTSDGPKGLPPLSGAINQLKGTILRPCWAFLN
jgi:hypothetical protein